MIKVNKENLNKPPKTRKQLKTISIEIYTCPACGQDLEMITDSDSPYYACDTENCGYRWSEITT